jgi:uncharacterized cysteine cluster protein YcgN (CxxCxxCC family)
MFFLCCDNYVRPKRFMIYICNNIRNNIFKKKQIFPEFCRYRIFPANKKIIPNFHQFYILGGIHRGKFSPNRQLKREVKLENVYYNIRKWLK